MKPLTETIVELLAAAPPGCERWLTVRRECLYGGLEVTVTDEHRATLQRVMNRTRIGRDELERTASPDAAIRYVLEHQAHELRKAHDDRPLH